MRAYPLVFALLLAGCSLATRSSQPNRKHITTDSGIILDGEELNPEAEDVQLRTSDQHVHLLRRSGEHFREVTSETGWPGYNAGPDGNRYSSLTGITKDNVAKLRRKWIFSPPGTGDLLATPAVVDGIMYVAAANECYALDAGSGRQIWHFRRPITPGIHPDAAVGRNRGVAVDGDRVFMVTDHAHLIALHRFTGALLWESEIADYRQSYFTTSAPLVARRLVVSGVSGGDEGASGVVVAFDSVTGKQAWRIHTVPQPGEPGSETWKGSAWEHGGAPTWMTGSYDPKSDTVFWPTGNPGPDYNGDERQGDNLFSDSVLALDAKTGKLKWYFQFTPHDLWDWDATETLLLVDATWMGKPRQLVLQANRNGFFYVLDRATGELLLAKPFIKKLTWARGIRPNGRPILNPNQEPTETGRRVCPSQSGATNWYSPSFDPVPGLLFVQTLDNCTVYKRTGTEPWAFGKGYLSGSQQPDPNGSRMLKAIDIQTGLVRWQRPQPGPGRSWGGTLATAAGLVIFGSESGELEAADSSAGKRMWGFQTNRVWRASPMTYSFDKAQYIAVAAGPDILVFGLP